VRLGGRRDRTIRVNLLPEKMTAFGVTTQDLLDAFGREHIQLPGGFVVGDRTESLVKLDLEFHQTAELEQMIVAYRDGSPVRLKDVAEVEDGLSDYRQLARFNRKPTIGIGIVKVANTNTVAIIEDVKQRLADEIIPQLPPGMTLSIVSNDALFIQEIIRALKEHLVEGTLLASLVVWLFLRSIRSTLIIATAIPVSLLGAIAVMYFAGYTFNSITMLALLLLIGVVVDDAIVVLENVFRHRQHLDPDPVSAAINGSNEVVFAVIAATLSLVCIFAPVIFLGGIIGQFFKSFAVVVTFGVLVSLFVSLTLTPMLCSRYLTLGERHGALYNALERVFTSLDRGYRWVLARSLGRRWLVVLLTVLVVLSTGWFFQRIGKTLTPDQDEGRFIINLRTPLGASIDYTNDRLKQVEAILQEHPEIVTEFAAIGFGNAGQVNQGFAVVRMAPREARTVSQQQSIATLRREFAQIPGALVFAAPYPIVGGQRGEPLQFVLSGQVLDEVSRLSNELQQRFAQEPGLGRMDLDLQLDLPQITLQPDRTLVADAGLSTQEVALALNILTGGLDVAKYNDVPGDGQRYDIRLKGREGEFLTAADLSKIYLRNKKGDLVRLDTVTAMKEGLGPAVIGRFDLQYAATFRSSPAMPLGEAVEKVKQIAAELLPIGYTVRFVGQAEELAKTVKYMSFAFGLALVLLYMVLASQFNSFLQPLIVMLAQPLAITGGVIALWLVGHTLNIYSMIGLVLLIGLVAKNSILLVDLTNQRRRQGMAVDAALLEACPIRMRPVLMTSLTIILALLPAALGYGAGAETNGPMAVAVIGGMISSTLLTLVVVPAVYSLVEGRRRGRPIAVSAA
jgi:HAE1 family hydrophobic/amphiphilic exporter-1